MSIAFTPNPANGTVFAFIKNDGTTLQPGDFAPQGATIVYNAQPAPEHYLQKWTGECENEPDAHPSEVAARKTCERPLNAPHQVGALFHAAVPLTFAPDAPGGTVIAVVKETGTTLRANTHAPRGKTVVYTAQPDEGHYLLEWSGQCASHPSVSPPVKYGLPSTCEIADASAPIGATFAPAQKTTFDLDPPFGVLSARIKNGAALQPGDYAPRGATIVYTATPNADTYLREWIGECESEPSGNPADFGEVRTCERPLNADHQVGAIFHGAVQLIFAKDRGNGTLSARVKGGEILNSGDIIDRSTTVVYAAHPAPGFYLLEWSGLCADQPPKEPNQHGLVQTCELSNTYSPIGANFARAWEITFNPIPQNGTLSARVQNGITLTPGDIAPNGATVIYTATPNSESYLREWTGDCAHLPSATPSDVGRPQTCQVTLSANSQAGALFYRPRPVSFVPQTNGTLSAQTEDGTPLLPGEAPALGATIVYTATPGAGFYLLEWTGACAGQPAATPNDRGVPQTCKVADAILPVDAIFARAWKISRDAPSPGGTISARIKNGDPLQPGDNVRAGTTVIYTAQPGPKHYLLEWTGECAGRPGAQPEERGEPRTCELTPAADITAGATYGRAWEVAFEAPSPSGTLSARIKNGGPLQSGGIVRDGTTVIYAAQPAPGLYLLEWTGACAGSPAAGPETRGQPQTCELTPNADITVGAAYWRSWEISYDAQSPSGTLSARIKNGVTLQSGDIVPRGNNRRLHRPARPQTLPAGMDRRMRGTPRRGPGDARRTPNLRTDPGRGHHRRRNIRARVENVFQPQPAKRDSFRPHRGRRKPAAGGRCPQRNDGCFHRDAEFKMLPFGMGRRLPRPRPRRQNTRARRRARMRDDCGRRPHGGRGLPLFAPGPVQLASGKRRAVGADEGRREITSGDFVLEGATVVFTATPSPGFHMTGWRAQAAGECDLNFDPALVDASAPQTCEAVIADDSFGESPPEPIFASSCPPSPAPARTKQPGQMRMHELGALNLRRGGISPLRPPDNLPCGLFKRKRGLHPPGRFGVAGLRKFPEGCEKVFGGEVRMVGTQPTCLGLDIQGTFCFINAPQIFPCRGLFKHVQNATPSTARH